MRILFVLVLYNTKLEQCLTYQTFLFQLKQDTIYVYDNSPHSQDYIKELVGYYIHDASNPGLGVAYNKAAQYAKDNHYDWLLFVDQDTTFPEGMYEVYLKAIQENRHIYMFAPPVCIAPGKYMSPVRLMGKLGRVTSCVPKGKVISLYKDSPINSGLCVSVDKFFQCRGYKPEVFLDYSDFQFIERFRKISDQCFIVDKEVYQAYSAFVDTPEKALLRLSLFCKSIRACDRYSIGDDVGYLLVVLKRTLSLVLKCKSLRPIQIFIQSYF